MTSWLLTLNALEPPPLGAKIVRNGSPRDGEQRGIVGKGRNCRFSALPITLHAYQIVTKLKPTTITAIIPEVVVMMVNDASRCQQDF